jgi:hypothetical protein
MKKNLAVFLVILFCATFAVADAKPIKFTLSLAFVGLGIADTALTIHGTKYPGLIETNRFMAPFFERGGTLDYFAIWNINLLGTAAILFACNALIHQDSKVCKILGYSILVTSVVFRGFVVIHNARLNARAR